MSFEELYRLVVIELHYQPEYFFDKMQLYELDSILKSYQYRFKHQYEMTRDIAYIIAQSNSTKKIKPIDIMKFEWDNQYAKEENKKKELTEEDIALYRKKAQEIIKQNFLIKK